MKRAFIALCLVVGTQVVLAVGWDDDTTYTVTFDGARNGVALRGNIAYYSTPGMLRIVDIVDPAAPKLLSLFKVGGTPGAVATLGDKYLCLLNGRRLIVFDVGDPAEPAVVSSIPIGTDFLTGPENIELIGNKAYVACRRNGLAVCDLSEVEKPRIVEELALPGLALDTSIDGDKMYVGCCSGVSVVDISESKPKLLKYVDTKRSARTIVAKDGYVFIGGKEYYESLDFRDLDNPKSLAEVVSITYGFYSCAFDMDLVGDLIYVANGEFGYYVIDWTDKSNPKIVIQYGNWQNSSEGVHYVYIRGLAVRGTYVYGSENFGDLLIFKQKLEAGKAPLPKLIARRGRVEYPGNRPFQDWQGAVEDEKRPIARGIGAFDNVLCAQDEEGVKFFDMSGDAPSLKCILGVRGTLMQVAPLPDNMLALATASDFAVFDCKIPYHPINKVVVKQWDGPGKGLYSFAVNDATNRVYLACGDAGIKAIDIADTALDLKTRQIANPQSFVNAVVLDGKTLYAATSAGLAIVSLGSEPVLKLMIAVEGGLVDLVLKDGNVIATTGTGKLITFSASDAVAGKATAETPLGQECNVRKMAIDGDTIYLAADKGLIVVNCADVAAPRVTATNFQEGFALTGVAVDRDNIFCKREDGLVSIVKANAPESIIHTTKIGDWYHE